MYSENNLFAVFAVGFALGGYLGILAGRLKRLESFKRVLFLRRMNRELKAQNEVLVKGGYAALLALKKIMERAKSAGVDLSV